MAGEVFVKTKIIFALQMVAIFALRKFRRQAQRLGDGTGALKMLA